MKETEQNRLKFESNYKSFESFHIRNEQDREIYNAQPFKKDISILFVPGDCKIRIDFREFSTTQPTLFFCGYQRIQVLEGKNIIILNYSRDFYCIQIHDAEVACDGLLFNNAGQFPATELSAVENPVIENLFSEIGKELSLNDSSMEEMVRILLKQIIIRATRLWKRQQLPLQVSELPAEVEFYRNFNQLVEIHFKQWHTVSDYAEAMGLTAKTLSNKFKRLNLTQPNELIKARIILEAKRLLCFTDWSVKEIAYELGYDDPAYFNRLFTGKAGDSPAIFKKKFLEGKNVQ
ncbi:helix-turn-helix domain-containing protein [Fluviicola sp.]|uniref:helix-turn-helix domain-containing protein n=1 Tax=Fluviicola sp. TaxID=1917219 RepID=UPI0031D105A6